MKFRHVIVLFMLLFSTHSLACEDSVTVEVNGMVCDFCARALEKVFSKRDEVRDIRVDLEDGNVTINYHAGKSMDGTTIRKLITDSGYDIVGIKQCHS